MAQRGGGPYPPWPPSPFRTAVEPAAVDPPVDAPAGPLPAAGWYADPAKRWRWRYWDGETWTPGVSNGTTVVQEPLPEPEVDRRIALPLRALWWALAGIVGGEILGGVLAYLADLASGHRLVVELLVGQAGLWAGFAAAVIIASRRYGTGHVFADFGVRAQRNDVWLGLGISFILRIAGFVVLLPITLGFRHYFEHAPSSEGVFDTGKSDKGALIALAAIAALGAPFIEELLFRGLIMGSLARLGRWWALILQGLLFASVHLRVSYGRSNILTFGAILVAGIGLGWCAQHYKRLGVGMFTHAWFNLLVVVILLSTSL